MRVTIRISIHALLAESDDSNMKPQPEEGKISIHALLAESDKHHKKGTAPASYFYPRSPCGERPPPGPTP